MINHILVIGKNGAENLASDLNVPFLGCIPIIQSIREASDIGRPAFMQDNSNVTFSKDLD